MKRLAVIIPCFNELESITQAIENIHTALADWGKSLELYVVVFDNHSEGKACQTRSSLKNPNVSCLRLSRRSGSNVPIRARLQMIIADAYAAVSAEGRDNPWVLPAILGRWKSGTDIVWTLRRGGGQYRPIYVRIPTEIVYHIILKIQTQIGSAINIARAYFFLIAQKVALAINTCSERNSSLFGLLIWMGFVHNTVEYDRPPRRHDQTSWSFDQRLKLARYWTLTFSKIPFKVVSRSGLAFGAAALLLFFVHSLCRTPHRVALAAGSGMVSFWSAGPH